MPLTNSCPVHFCARFNPLSMCVFRNSGELNKLKIASAICSGLLGSTSIAASPNCSSAPETFDAMTGQPRAKASRGGRFSGPKNERKRKAKAFCLRRLP